MLSPSEDNIMDTVGVICFDTKGNIASRASSSYIIYETLFPTIVTGLQSCGISSIVRCRLLGLLKRTFWGSFHTVLENTNERICSSEVLCLIVTTGPASACMKVLRSVAQDSNQADTGKSAGILIVLGNPPKLKAIEIAAAYSSLSFGIGYFGINSRIEVESIILKLKLMFLHD
ncbi:hypothetical protein CXB51_031603 [Gossypium anomalum]|uniref:Uncharacterized protein n=1 Tax=Gossypium anomalum TaxID=47600 RepID=A0A8J6CJN6_9ROSI|nr:hypothetical protein CXB51_031603 [Gossypium anomalum]